MSLHVNHDTGHEANANALHYVMWRGSGTRYTPPTKPLVYTIESPLILLVGRVAHSSSETSFFLRYQWVVRGLSKAFIRHHTIHIDRDRAN